MTIKPEVLAAFDEWMDFILAECPSGENNWKAIRAELLAKDAEIADLIRKRDFLLRHYNDAESRLAAADALLRKCRYEFAGLPHSLGYDFTHLPELDAYLSEISCE